ncbi:MAG: sugar ABC transporter permease [Thermomicrobiales bacterium]|nr:sugar ABC transporter permease [Thermomicrobiales bacterium]
MSSSAGSFPPDNPQSSPESRYAGQLRAFPWLLVAPTVILLIALTIFPLIYSLYMSLHNFTLGGAKTWIGLDNYRDLLSDRSFWRKTWFTLQITIFAVAIELVLGLLCALVLNKRLRGLGLLRMIVYIPMMLSPLVVAYFWRIMLDGSFGVFTWFAQELGFGKPQWTVDLTLAKASIVATDVWQWTPFVTLLMLAGLQAVHEAAELDKGTRWMTFRSITLPYLMTPILIAVLFRTIDTFKLFEAVYIITQGGPGDLTETLSLMAYTVGFEQSRIGMGAAISWFVVVVINVLATLLIMLMARSRRESVMMAEVGDDE